MMNPEFEVHMLNDTGKINAQLIAMAFNRCLVSLDGLCPSGRHMSIVRTKLEEACFFAKKAMASYPANKAGNHPDSGSEAPADDGEIRNSDGTVRG